MVQEETMGSLKEEEVEESGRSQKAPPNKWEESHEKTSFTVLQKNTRSMSSSERFEELLHELHGAKWDVILISETWRPSREIWETEQGHVLIESGKFTKKHAVGIILSRRWKKPDQLG